MGTTPERDAVDASRRSSDGRWVLIGGRRWRATDPSIPTALSSELVDAVMQARRAVGAAKRAGDQRAERTARAEVHRAKVALGERGAPWWEKASEEAVRERLEAAVLTLADHRAPNGTLCPSDAARIVGGATWRQLMPAARDAVRGLAARGEVVILQKGERIDVDAGWVGPIRVRRA
jgi:hypothetical protein